MNETAANASAYIAYKGIYEWRTDYNCRSTKLGENEGKCCLMTHVNIKKILPRTCFLKKKPQRQLHMETQQGGCDV